MRRAATVLLLSNRSKTRGGSFDVLMVKRHSKARFMANTYVFPGGCADAEDEVHSLVLGLSQDPLGAFRVGAARELREETGIALRECQSAAGRTSLALDVVAEATPVTSACSLLTPFAHWVTPKQERYRYDTWFFTAEADEDFAARFPASLLKPDLREVADVKWLSPQEALEHHHNERDSSFRLPPPTYLVMQELSTFRTAADVVAQRAALVSSGAVFPVVEPVLELDPATIGGPTIIRRMHMQSNWIPTSVLPKNADGSDVREYTFPVYDEAGVSRLSHVCIHDAADMPLGVAYKSAPA
jgi:8-oxo-dGTP pyrophosphatase MutT (NUDIX family)